MQTASKVLEIRDSSKPYKDSTLINTRKNHKATMSLFSSNLIEENGYEAGQSYFVVCLFFGLVFISVWRTSQCIWCMSWAWKIVHSHGPLDKNLGIIFTSFNLAMLHNVSTLLTMVCLLGKNFFKMFLAEVGMWKTGVQEVTNPWISCWF